MKPALPVIKILSFFNFFFGAHHIHAFFFIKLIVSLVLIEIPFGVNK